MKKIFFNLTFSFSLAGLGALSVAAAPHSLPPASADPQGFVKNAGQLRAAARYYAIGQSSAVYFEPTQVVLDRTPNPGVEGVVLRVDFPRAPAPPRLVAAEPQDGRVNVFVGKDPGRWRQAIPVYGEVRYGGIAPGADLVYRVQEGRLKYDLVLAPGADLSKAVLRYRGADQLSIDRDGALVVVTAAGELSEAAPRLYQEVEGRRVAVAGGYRIVSRREVGFWAAGYDHDRTLVVDPGMTWSTFVGGTGVDCPVGVATNQAGEVFIVGYSASTDYPTSSGVYQAAKRADDDVIVTKLHADGSMAWSTYLGGSRWDAGRGVAVDVNGNVYVCGETISDDFPVTAGAFRTAIGMSGTYDAFVTKIGPNGNVLSYSTYLGGISDDYGNSIGVNSSGQVTVAGTTGSTDFPTTSGVVKPTRTPQLFDGSDGFVAKLNGTGTGLVYSTYVGSNSGSDLIRRVALDANDRATVTGSTASPDFPTTASAMDRTFGGIKEAFAARLNETGSAYVFSTYLGGSAVDEGFGIAVDAAGNTYAVGATTSTDFPTAGSVFQPNWGGGTSVYDGYVVKLSPTGSALFSSFLGASGSDAAYGVAVSAGGSACVTGACTSTNFPVTAGAISGVYSGGAADAFVTVIAPSGASLAYSTYLGSSGNDQACAIAVRTDGRVVVAGYTDGTTFPTTAGAFDRTHSGTGTSDGFVTVADMGLGSATAVGDVEPARLDLTGPSPNPFRSKTSCSLRLDQPGHVRVRVLDTQGRLVQVVFDQEVGSGWHTWAWNGKNDQGVEAMTGIYLIQVTTPWGSEARRVALLR